MVPVPLLVALAVAVVQMEMKLVVQVILLQQFHLKVTTVVQLRVHQAPDLVAAGQMLSVVPVLVEQLVLRVLVVPERHLQLQGPL